MRGVGNTLRSAWRRLQHSERGAAAVEFALILPLMLLVYIGSLEASTLITMDRKVQSVAGAVGDLVARSEKTIRASDLQDYFRAAAGIMTPFSPTGVTQVITAVKVQGGVPRVVWTRQYLNGTYSSTTPYTAGNPYPLPTEMRNIAGTKMVIAAEATYTYTPLLGIVLDTPVNLYRSSFFMTRFGDDIAAP
ncbi:Flp pilus assembly protein TadG [Devosia lucknowensis]|uniref:Flp pilus assembly protein TadG n=1 Tax=Devosia lucknowensis TaxID=1096929 RepID=A0A1Y6EDS6_9HYPH|nr:TadE/TadG family type IV pilus assembly protein [Devosia lucknowensis]SMQ58333.1 Flp pilus assembly protein TadG [Devosia lucknowensis]